MMVLPLLKHRWRDDLSFNNNPLLTASRCHQAGGLSEWSCHNCFVGRAEDCVCKHCYQHCHTEELEILLLQHKDMKNHSLLLNLSFLKNTFQVYMITLCKFIVLILSLLFA